MAVVVFAGQQATRQREIGQKPDAEFIYYVEQFIFRLAEQHAVLVLGGNQPVQVVMQRRPVRVHHFPWHLIARPDIADLALADEIVEGAAMSPRAG